MGFRKKREYSPSIEEVALISGIIPVECKFKSHDLMRFDKVTLGPGAHWVSGRNWVRSDHGASWSWETQLENRDRTEQSREENVSTNPRSKASSSSAQVCERARNIIEANPKRIYYILLCLMITFQFSVWILWLRPGSGGRHYPCPPHNCPLIPAAGDGVWNDLEMII